jgi:UDP-2,3-diacylglucosamine hydrolase
MAHYFISDLHLSDEQPHLLELFEYFLSNVLKPRDTLYILGDLFEYWVGEDKQSNTIQQVKILLLNLQKRQIEWFFLAGNRDFLLNKTFIAKTHGTLLPEKKCIILDDHPVLLLHGDTLCSNDLAYQAFRRKVTQKWLQHLFLWLPFFIRKKIALQMRKQSSTQGKILDEKIMDVCERTVAEEFEQYQARIMIHGHVHRPGVHAYWQQKNQQWQWRYVLADWDKKANYLRYADGAFTLHYLSMAC